jgi:hypothetical protein
MLSVSRYEVPSAAHVGGLQNRIVGVSVFDDFHGSSWVIDICDLGNAVDQVAGRWEIRSHSTRRSCLYMLLAS